MKILMSAPGFLGLPNPVEEFFKFIDRKLRQLATSMYEGILDFVNHPVDRVHSAWEYTIIGNQLGLAQYMIVMVVMLSTIIAMFLMKKIVSVFHGLGIALAIAIVGPNLFVITDGIKGAGFELMTWARSLQNFLPAGGGGFKLPAAVNIIGDIGGIIVMLFFGTVLMSIIALYSPGAFVVQNLLLVAMAISPLGGRSQKFLNIVLATGLVTMLTGPALAVLGLVTGQLMSAYMGGGRSSFLQVFYLVIGLLLAIVLQFVAWSSAMKAVNNVTGKMRSRMEGGNVDARIRNPNSGGRKGGGKSSYHTLRNEMIKNGVQRTFNRSSSSRHGSGSGSSVGSSGQSPNHAETWASYNGGFDGSRGPSNLPDSMSSTDTTGSDMQVLLKHNPHLKASAEAAKLIRSSKDRGGD